MLQGGRQDSSVGNATHLQQQLAATQAEVARLTEELQQAHGAAQEAQTQVTQLLQQQHTPQQGSVQYPGTSQQQHTTAPATALHSASVLANGTASGGGPAQYSRAGLSLDMASVGSSDVAAAAGDAVVQVCSRICLGAHVLRTFYVDIGARSTLPATLHGCGLNKGCMQLWEARQSCKHLLKSYRWCSSNSHKLQRDPQGYSRAACQE